MEAVRIIITVTSISVNCVDVPLGIDSFVYDSLAGHSFAGPFFIFVSCHWIFLKVNLSRNFRLFIQISYCFLTVKFQASFIEPGFIQETPSLPVSRDVPGGHSL